MNKNLTCNQVSALINFYIEDKLNSRLKEYVDIHLSKCPHCNKKINDLKKILSKFGTSNNIPAAENKIDKNMLKKLSAYVDNELNTNENIRIKKMTISNPTARQELENIYKFKKAILYAYEKTKNDNKLDYAKSIVNSIQEGYDYSTDYFYKLAAIFVLLISAIIVGFIYLSI